MVTVSAFTLTTAVTRDQAPAVSGLVVVVIVQEVASSDLTITLTLELTSVIVMRDEDVDVPPLLMLSDKRSTDDVMLVGLIHIEKAAALVPLTKFRLAPSEIVSLIPSRLNP